MAKLSNYDQQYLSSDQQAQIKALKEQYAAAKAANDEDAMEKAHADAEKIRNSAGYSSGTDGTGHKKLAANQGGETYEDVKKWLEDYKAAGYDKERGWVNGYSVSMNNRSRDNYVRQQMLANSQAWHSANAEEREYLHKQNELLADLLGASSYYDEETGTWGTYNTNSGYGKDLNATMPNVVNSWKNYYGYTDEMMDKWSNDTSHYFNFVDTRVPARYNVDESSGFTGQYAQFVNGPYGALMGGATGGTRNVPMSVYTDVIGDGWGTEKLTTRATPTYDENGNIVQTAPLLKNNNDISDYTRQFAAYTQNGIIMPNSLTATNPGNAHALNGAYTGVTPGQSVPGSKYSGMEDTMPNYVPNVNDGNNMEGQKAYADAVRQNTGLSPSALSASRYSGISGTSGMGGYSDYINQLYNASLQAQLESLKTSYEQNLSELDASVGQVNDAYVEQKRQAAGESAQQAAAWREMANAYGLNSGAVGQAALAQRNQLQEELNTLGTAQAAALTEIQRQRTVLGQQYQAAINQASAESDFQRLSALYQEAVRVDEALTQQEQYYTNLFLKYGQSLVGQLGGTVSG